MISLGRQRPGSTIFIPFESFASASGAPITITNFVVGDIKVYKDGGTTERASTNGYTLLDTDGIDFDGITGIHGFSIDLSDNSTADFWACGSRYFVVVSTITVDTQTMSFVAATFRIGYESSILDTTIASLSSQTSFTLAAGPAEDDALNGCILVIHDAASAVQQSLALVQDYTGSTKTVTLAAAPTFTIAAKDNISVMTPSLQATVPGRQLVVDAAGLADANVVKIGPSGSGTAQTAGDLPARLTAARAGYLDNLNVGGNVASSAEVLAVQNNTRVVRVVPAVIERPDVGSPSTPATYRIELLLYDTTGNMETPDSAPTIDLVDQAGTGLNSRLSSTTMSLISTGRYRVTYTADAADALGQLIWAFSVVEGGQTRIYGNTSLVVDTTAADFTATDRAKLDTLHDTRIPGVIQPQTGDSFARLGAPAGASHAADVAAVKTDTGSIKTVSDLHNTMIETAFSPGGARYTAEALELAPTGTGGGSCPTAADVRAEMDSNSTRLADINTDTDLLAQLVELSSPPGGPRLTQEALENAPSGGGSAPSAATIAAAVWDLATSGHTTAGTFGAQAKTLLDLIATYIDTEVATIITELAKVPKSDSTVSLNATALAAIADALLNRDMATGTDSGSNSVRTLRQAIRFLRNKWTSSGGTLTVYKEDDATPSWTAAISATAGADPITGVDPAGP